MSSPAGGVLRLTRAAALGGATVGLALAAHVLAGGAAPTPVGVGLLTLPTLALALLATRTRLSGPAVAALIGASQVGLHTGLTVLAAPTGVVGEAAPPAAGHHLLHLGLGPAGLTGVVDPSGVAGGVGGAAGAGGAVGGAAVWAGLAMTAAHVVAAGLLALLLARGEQALWSLVGWLVPRLPGPVRTPRSVGRPLVPARDVVVRRGHGHRRRSRGPPLLPAAVPAPSA